MYDALDNVIDTIEENVDRILSKKILFPSQYIRLLATKITGGNVNQRKKVYLAVNLLRNVIRKILTSKKKLGHVSGFNKPSVKSL